MFSGWDFSFGITNFSSILKAELGSLVIHSKSSSSSRFCRPQEIIDLIQFYGIILIMNRSSELKPLERMVLEGKKPGAFVSSPRPISQSMSLYESVGLEGALSAVYDPQHLAIGHPTPALDIWEDFTLTSRLEVHAENLTRLASEIGSRTTAHALAFLNAYPRGNHPLNLEDIEVAIMEGALLGYHEGCVDYYVGTRYEGEPADPDVLSLNEILLLSMNEEAWPDPHILCPPCSVEKRA